MATKLETIFEPAFSMRFAGSDAWIASRPCVTEEERTQLIAKWAARAVQCGRVITGIRLYQEKRYGKVITYDESEGK